MTLSNVKLVLGREIRDQLRDRRTLFMIVVLPILLYPLLGMSMFQLSQFMQDQPSRVLVIGATDRLKDVPPLFEDEHFAEALFSEPGRARLLAAEFATKEQGKAEVPANDARAGAFADVQAGRHEASLYFPADFARRLDAFREAIRHRSGKLADKQQRLEVPNPEIIYSTANDKSQIAFARLSEVLRRWTDQISDDNLAQSGVSAFTLRPFSIGSADVAGETGHRGAAMWSKILPVLLLIWALTGAFYPAIDLCAGEKERGTLETLLSSPAERGEIVLGKLLTVMLFSIATVVLNMVSIGITSWMVLSQSHLPDFEMPPLATFAAIGVALLPIAALFSALCVALAAFARSTKEGQYYLMPLLLITMPLVVLPMSPGVELNLGTSLIPLTGMVLLLRSMLEGNYWQAIQFSPAVALVTMMACMLSIRWAVDQFNSESVLFRESERLNVGLWIRHLFRDRQPTPSAAMAASCGVLILVVQFFMGLLQSPPNSFGDFARSALSSQLLVIAIPAMLMTLLLTTSVRQTLLLRLPKVSAVLAATLLAVALHPMTLVLREFVNWLYPMSERVRPALENIQSLLGQADFWPLVLLIAVVPPICEELAFRGFILSGFRHVGHKWRAIVYSALLFGLAHGILQQSLIACLLGTILGFLAVQTGSILPGMAFHVAHNTLVLANSRVSPEMIPTTPLVRNLVTPLEGGGCQFHWPVAIVGVGIGVLLLLWFARLSFVKSKEETLEDAIERNDQDESPLAVDETIAIAVAD